MAAIIGVSAAQTQTATTAAAKTGTDELGKDAFLKLLITQLGNQDPLNPMNDTEFISQMAQFSALEQMTNLNTSMVTTQAAGMIGKQITWAENGEEVTGVVSAVRILDGQPNLMVGETAVQLNKVMSIADLVIA